MERQNTAKESEIYVSDGKNLLLERTWWASSICEVRLKHTCKKSHCISSEVVRKYFEVVVDILGSFPQRA
jgi:hypothetical protein